MRLPVNHVPALAALVLLAACGGAGAKPVSGNPAVAVNGPAADYPIVLGDPFTIAGTTYTPNDRLNYDDVGYAIAGGEGGEGVTIAHKTLPLPSYAEVTSLDTGRTILVRVERRGPMVNDRLVELSPGAATQLGLTGATKAAIRIRRVNPPEMERAMLRSGHQAPGRMDTPGSLPTVLKRKLDPALVAPALPPVVAATPAPVATPKPAVTPKPRANTRMRPVTAPVPTPTPTPVVLPAAHAPAKPAPSPAPVAKPSPAPKPASSPAPAHPAATTTGNFIVQIGAFGNAANAHSASDKVGGSLRSSGNLTRVVMGPFATRGQAEAALARAKAAGYKDARVQAGR